MGLDAAGTERVTITNAGGLAARGHRVEVLVTNTDGALAGQLPPGVEVIPLRRASLRRARATALWADPAGVGVLARPLLLAKRTSVTLPYLPDLARFLRRERPPVLVSAMPPLNIEALLARRLAQGAAPSTRVMVTEHSNLSQDLAGAKPNDWRRRGLADLMRHSYAWADRIVAVSNGVADDVAAFTGIPRERIDTIYNPVVTPELLAKAEAPVDHPWFRPGGPPVLLGVGRLARQKDFATLIRAFARVRARGPARLAILGDAVGNKTPVRQQELLSLARELGVADDVWLAGFVANPYAYMANASVFVLSSRFEGLPTVLIEAMACGCPVVSTNCPNGPQEVLDGGEYGPLVPVGDARALGDAVAALLERPPSRERMRVRGRAFGIERAVDRYQRLLFPESECPPGQDDVVAS